MRKDIFNMPNPVTIMGRSSSITNSFVNGIIPSIKPTDVEIKKALQVLEQNEDDVRCVYCGDKKTEWDHLHPLIIDKKPTGYITEIANLVPACGKCNQSKGNSDWKEWMLSDAEKSPKTRKIPDINKRIQLIEKYENLFKPHKVELEKIAGNQLWKKYMDAYESIISQMKDAQKIMDEIKKKTSISLPPKKHQVKASAPKKFSTVDGLSSKKSININGISLPIYRNDNQSVQDFVKQTLTILFKNNLLTSQEILNLQEKKYCTKNFGIQYPLLKKDSTKITDECGHLRYWSKFKVDKFFVCSQWWKDKFNLYDSRIAQWLCGLTK